MLLGNSPSPRQEWKNRHFPCHFSGMWAGRGGAAAQRQCYLTYCDWGLHGEPPVLLQVVQQSGTGEFGAIVGAHFQVQQRVGAGRQ